MPSSGVHNQILKTLEYSVLLSHRCYLESYWWFFLFSLIYLPVNCLRPSSCTTTIVVPYKSLLFSWADEVTLYLTDTSHDAPWESQWLSVRINLRGSQKQNLNEIQPVIYLFLASALISICWKCGQFIHNTAGLFLNLQVPTGVICIGK